MRAQIRLPRQVEVKREDVLRGLPDSS